MWRRRSAGLMIDDCSVETVGEKLKRQGFGGEEEDESGHESVEKPRTPALTSPCQKTTDGIDGERIENQPTHSSETSSPRSVLNETAILSLGVAKSKPTPSNSNSTTPFSPPKSHKLNVTDKTIHLVLFKPKPTPHWPPPPRHARKVSPASKPTLTPGKTKTKSWKTRMHSRSTRRKC